MYVEALATLLARAATDIAAGGIYDAPKMALYTNDIIPSRGSLYADFTVADFGGLTNKKAITFGAAALNANGQAESLGALLTWATVNGTSLPITAYGLVILDTAGTVLIQAERFATPFLFDTFPKALSILPRLVWDT